MQLLREVYGPTLRIAIALPMPGGGKSKSAKETAADLQNALSEGSAPG